MLIACAADKNRCEPFFKTAGKIPCAGPVAAEEADLAHEAPT